MSAFLYIDNAWYIEQLYETYLKNPQDVSAKWQSYFASLENNKLTSNIATNQLLPDSAMKLGNNQKQAAVLELINAYRFQGHRQADLDPLQQYERPEIPELAPAFHHLNADDMDTIFNTGSLCSDNELPLHQIIDILQTVYCRSIGIEYMHINESKIKVWIQKYIESRRGIWGFDSHQKIQILEQIIAANVIEEYLHTKYVGQKRFSLEGGESLIPMLNFLLQSSGAQTIREIVIGMAHRGRLNVLVNIIGKSPRELFDEFENKTFSAVGSGDVKYHLGYSTNIKTPQNNVHVTLSFNPSHLEIIAPVVEGSVRARQERRKDTQRNQVLPVVIHGDAAFAGQGVVMETLNLSQARGYATGGTIHIVINNQIGFTTSDPLDSRSTLYCTDVAKMIQAPILHVNSDDPEAVVFVTQLALDFRMQFNRDIVIDMVCYRKHGHSETDEPSTTQPVMYQRIQKHLGVRHIYSSKLIKQNLISDEKVENLVNRYIDNLDNNKTVLGKHTSDEDTEFRINFLPYIGSRWDAGVDTSINTDTSLSLTKKIIAIPDHYKIHKSIQKLLNDRRKMGNGQLPMDWGFAETIAYASLLESGYSIRISGQDSSRGTFAHRHAVIHNINGETWLPLQHLTDKQGQFLPINSTLSEEAVLAYEYGYSAAEPEALVIWEAQFGDFANNAQVVFDQFISSCEAKWGRYCGLIVMLPHGYDGQGPEHSSARLERFLQLCAEENMQVCVPSTSGQMFHLLRRQILRPYRKPLIIMTPKSMLRLKESCSPVTELTQDQFKLVIDEIDDMDATKIVRLLFCCGKIYYDLLKQRREKNIKTIAIARIEQLFPFPTKELKEMIANYPHLKEIVWVQEEPKNQGTWYYMQSRGTLIGCMNEQHQLGYAGRFYSASPATGHMSKHLQQQKQIVSDALQFDKMEVTHKR